MKHLNDVFKRGVCIFCAGLMLGTMTVESYAYAVKDVHKWHDIQSFLKGDYKYDKTDVLVSKVYTLTRYYDSAHKHRGIFGNGWTANVEVTYYITDLGITVLRTGNTEYSLYPLAEYDVSTQEEILQGLFSVCVEGITYTFDSHRCLIRIKDISSGKFMNISYDELSRIESLTDKYERSLSFRYNADGMVEQVYDPYGRTVSYTYDTAGNLLCMQGPDNNAEIYAYDAQNRLTGIGVGYESFLTRIGYDDSGHLAFIKTNHGISELFDYARIAEGELKVIRQEQAGARKEIFYRTSDTALQVEVVGTIQPQHRSATHPTAIDYLHSDAKKAENRYDDRKNLVSQTDEFGRLTSVKYDFWNNPIEIKKHDGQTIYLFYDEQKNLVRIENVKENGTVQ